MSVSVVIAKFGGRFVLAVTPSAFLPMTDDQIFNHSPTPELLVSMRLDGATIWQGKMAVKCDVCDGGDLSRRALAMHRVLQCPVCNGSGYLLALDPLPEPPR